MNNTHVHVLPILLILVRSVDEKLYSRQLYVMGHEAQRRMMSSSALLVGLSGLGAEVAKNIILAGIASVTLCDPEPANSFDLGGNFYLSEDDVAGAGSGRGRADLVRNRLAELNQYVRVDTAALPPATAASLSSAGAVEALCALVADKAVVVITVPLPHSTVVAINEACRASSTAFIYAYGAGAFGKIFCDFGKAFTISDKDGENPATSQVETILPTNPAAVKVLEDQGRHGLETGDKVTFSKVKGLGGLMSGAEAGSKQYEVKVTGPFTFELVGCDFSACAEPATQGYITQVKQAVTMSFRRYEECTSAAKPEDGELMMSDFAKFDRPGVLHTCFRALEEYSEKAGGMALPNPGDAAAADAVLAGAKTMDKEAFGDNAANARIAKQLASGSRAVLSPICATLGGIVGQEVLKACSGKFTPIKGFFYIDADECLPEDLLPADEVAPSGTSRYDSQIAVFGRAIQSKILDLNYFLVGAGAIGCEMLKNWALMGVGCGDSGKVHVTDMDRIEKSNLSRQFLFRSSDINEFKSTTAARSAQTMNPQMKVVAYQDKVAPDTEHTFGDNFYDKLSGVCTALDNVEARLYVDQRCLFYRLPMLESGTLGTKGNTQVVVPHVTENYGATRDPPEKSIPVCTLKNFPNQIQHTLQWARDYFEGEFRQGAEDVNSYLASSDFAAELASQQATKLESAKTIRRVLVDERPTTFEDCIIWARLKFEDLFANQVKQLLHNFPEDQVTSSGTKFWSGSKRCPKALLFDLDTKCEDAEMRNCFDFIVAAANLRASMFGITGSTDEATFRETLKNVIVPDFAPQEGVKIAANDAEAKEQESAAAPVELDVDMEVAQILESLPSKSELAGYKLTPIDFDKDIDDHMLFVTACSNLRAMNYSIPTEDTHRSRAIAGRIIPAIATTTALVTGLICLELYKIVGSARRDLKLEDLKNGFCNLAIPFMTLSEPQPPATTKAILKGKEWNWSAWDSLDIMDKGDLTLQELLDFFESEYKLEISMLSYGVSILYSFFANKKKVAERKKMKMSELVQSISKKELPSDQLFLVLEVIATDMESDEDVELPYLKLRIR